MSNYSKLKVSYKTHKTLKLRLKQPYLGIFNQECEKILSCFTPALSNSLKHKVLCKAKNLTFGTKKALFG